MSQAIKVIAIYNSNNRRLIRYEYNGKAITTQQAINLLMQKVGLVTRSASQAELKQIGNNYVYPEEISQEALEAISRQLDG